jgi:threonine/homoserine/homoserine lactone efflux protein
MLKHSLFNIGFSKAYTGCKLPFRRGRRQQMDQYLPLVLFTIVSTITPGGATTLATASGAHFGFWRSVPLIAGIAFGLATMAAAAAAGLAGVLLNWPSLQFAMKSFGSAYLLWLAIRIARSGPPHLQKGFSKPTSLVGGFWMLWHNPKGWAMSMGAAASFSVLASGPVHLALLLGLTFGGAAAVSLIIWCMAGQILARVIQRDWQWRALNVTLGALLLGSIIAMWWK